MPDAITRLNTALEGRYRIARELGEGGMATVYLADDIKHERKVALKVLKPELAAVVGADRFLAEIKTTANLQHPHILPLHDSGEADGFLYYVMPYIEGETLRDRLEREMQLPVDEAVRIATDVAEALHSAHRQGVIHRDIKPANILLSEGRPLVADFGIALAVSAAGGGRLTATGLSMGTPHYMSPEQASTDREPTPASDVYSIGCVLYEMLVGDPPYTASSAQAVLAKILTEEARSPTSARSSIPANVDAAVRKALEKLPADRFTDASSFVRALADPAFVHRPAAGGAAISTPGTWNRLSTIAVGTSTVLAASLAWVLLGGESEAPPVLHSAIALPPGETLALADYAPSAAGRPSVALAPDGTGLAFVAAGGDASRLFFQDLTDGSQARELSGTEGAFNPFFSPDGEWLGFFTETELKRVGVRGGTPLTLTSATYAVGADWHGPDEIVYSDAEGKRLQRVSAETGELDVRLDVAEGLAWWPEVLPDGETVLVTNTSAGAFPSIVAVSLVSGERTLVIRRGSGARYVEGSGHLVYAGEGGIMAVPFDPRSAAVTGTAVPVLQGVRLEAYGRVPQLALSDVGLVAFAPGEDLGISTPVWVDRGGSVEPLPLPAARYGPLRLSPDRRLLAISVVGARGDVRLYDFVSGSDLTPLSTMSEDHRQPLWSADGRRVAFVADVGMDGADRQPTLFVQELGGGSPERPLEKPPPGSAFPQAWSPNGDLVLSVQIVGAETDMWVLPSGEREARPFLEVRGDQWAGDFSPDGRWLAYHSDESGMQEVYITDYPGGVIREMVSTHPGEGKEPIWSPLGDEVFYRSDGALYAAPVQAGDSLTVGTPVRLFRGPFVTVGGPEFDVGPEAQRFLMLREPVQPPATSIRLIANWFEELKRLVPN